jgi:FkbM family methyltransferase
MKLKFRQRIAALLGAFEARQQLKQTLLRNYWAKKKTFPLNLPGVDITFATDDFYSTAFFYQQSQVENYIYEPAITKLLVGRLKHCRCFADVGANLGYFTTIAAKVRPDITVYAFEMDETLLPVIQRNLSINHIANAKIVSAPVGDEERAFRYKPHPYGFLSKVSGIPTGLLEVTLPTRTIRLDDFFNDKPIKPDLMKVDIDGSEMAMLRGSESLLAQDELEMFLEVHTHHLPLFGSSTAEVLEFLRHRGFRCFRIVGFRETSDVEVEDISDRPEVLTTKTGDMLYVTKDKGFVGFRA